MICKEKNKQQITKAKTDQKNQKQIKSIPKAKQNKTNKQRTKTNQNQFWFG